VPESGLPSRYCDNASACPAPNENGDAGAAPAEVRLRVLWSLPPAHQRYVFEEIRRLSRLYLRNRRVLASEVTPEEFVSEIWQKLLGTVSLNNAPESLPVPPAEWSIDPLAPERDGRVAWLIRTNWRSGRLVPSARGHLRQRFGRSSPERGRRIVQPGIEDGPSDAGSSEPEGGRGLMETGLGC
jgi:hypothetical protein